MSLFGSLSTGVSALTAQSQKTSIISNNIANLSTTGFKRSEATFQSLVTNSNSSTLFSPGTVTSERIQRVTEQGPIQQSSSNTDVSISGNGFFTTKDANNADQPFQYTRNGQFSETAEGLMRNASGKFLYGWRLEDGELPAGRDDLSSLEPVNVSLQENQVRQTQEAEFGVNLDRGAEDEVGLPASSNQGGQIKDVPASFSRGLTVFDSQGSAQQLNFDIKKTYGPMATATSATNELNFDDQLVNDVGMTDGGQFTIGDETGTMRTYDVGSTSGGDVTVNTVGDVINDIDNNLNGISAFLGNRGEMIIQRDNFQNGDEQLRLQDINTADTISNLGLTSGGTSPNVFDATNLNGRNTFSGSVSSETTGLADTDDLVADLGFSATSNTFNGSFTSDTGGALSGTDALTGIGFAAGDDIQLTDNQSGASTTFTVNAGDDVNDLLTSLGGTTNVTASLVGGEMRFTQNNGDNLQIQQTAGGGTGLQDNGLIGDQIELTDNESGNTEVFTVSPGDTLNDLRTDLDSLANISSNISPAGALTFTQNNGNDFTLNDVRGSGLQSLGMIDNPFSNGGPGDSPSFSGEEFPALQNTPGDTGYNSRGWWQVNIKDTNNNEISNGLLNFNSDGSINAIPDSEGNVDINLNQIEWGNGTEPQNIDVDISGFSQVDGDFTVNFSNQDGAEVGQRTGVSIDQEGFVRAQFSNGTDAELFKLPLATFANPNGLIEESGTAFTESQESGSVNLREAGEGGSGLIEPGTLENSNVDLADEFSKMIVSQRAYSAGTRVITTVDQMTQELLRIQR